MPPEVNATAGIWSTYPTAFLSQGNGFGDQVFGTFLLLLCVRGITDEKNAKVPTYLVPFLVGLVVLNIGISFGYNCGYAINPARDLGPRIFTLLCGYGTEVFRYNDIKCKVCLIPIYIYILYDLSIYS